MRHRISGNKLSRNQSLRKATLRDLAKATLIEQRICTTKIKAKEARKLVDKLITLGKKGTLADKRRAFAILCDHKLVSELFNETSSRFKNRVGGYTRIITLGNRRGDNAQLVYLELTEKKEVIVSKPKTSSVKKAKKEVDAAKTEEASVEPQDPKKEHSHKKPDLKQKGKAAQTKDKTQRTFGIKNIFNRKTGGE